MSDPITRQQLERRLDETHTVEQQWERKGTSFSLYAPKARGSGPRLLVKQPSRWNADNAATAFATLSRCREAAETRSEPHFVARPYWWGTDPPFLCVEWIEGKALRSLMAAGLVRDGDSSWLLEPLTAAGAFLARYHIALADWPVASDAVETEGQRRLTTVARRIAGPDAPSVEIPVRSFSDPNPGNFVIDRQDRLWLIDLPSRVEMRALQLDLALLVYWLGRLLNRGSRQGRIGISYEAVIEAVRAGYASQLPGALASEPSTALFYSFLACEATRKMVTERTVKGRLTLVNMTGRVVGRSLIGVGRARMANQSSELMPRTPGAQLGPGSAAPTPTHPDAAEELP